MKCHFCGAEDTKVIDSRPTEDGRTIRRRRECIVCQRRFTTYEKYEEHNLMVIKKDGTRQLFNPNKVLNGMIKSCEKRPVPMETLEDAATRVERKIMAMDVKEVPSRMIGELIMDELKRIDQVAYVRFASVYREFTDLDSFNETIRKLKSDKDV